MLDNIKIVKYSSADGTSPVADKYELREAIRQAEEDGTTDAAVLTAAKAIYEKEYALQSEVDAVCESLVSTAKTFYYENFENYTPVYAMEEVVDDDTYAIGKAGQTNLVAPPDDPFAHHTFTPVVWSGEGACEANTYAEAEFDVCPDGLGNANALISFRGYKNANSTNQEFLSLKFVGTEKSIKLNGTTVLADYSDGNWHRVKFVMQLTDASGAAAYTVKRVLLDGRDVLPASDSDYIFSSTSPLWFDDFVTQVDRNTAGDYALKLDNISVRTYTSADGTSPIAEKGKLVSLIRGAGSDVSSVILKSAKAVYESITASQTEIDKVCEEFTKDSDSAFSENFENASHAFDTVVVGAEANASISVTNDSTYNIDNVLKIDAIYDTVKEYSTRVYTTDKFSGGYLSDSRVGENGANAYVDLNFDMLVSDVDKIADYYIDFSLGCMTGETFRESATIRFHQSKDQSDDGIKYWVPDGGVTETDSSLTRTLCDYNQKTWYNVRLKIHLTDETGAPVKLVEAIYVNGENLLPNNEPLRLRKNSNITELNSMMIRVKGYYKTGVAPYAMVDNVKLERYNLPEHPVQADALIAKIREIEYEKAQDEYSASQLVKIEPALEQAKSVLAGAYTQNAVDEALTALQASLPVYTGIPIYIPGNGTEQKNTSVRLALHYGEQEGIEAFDEIFLNGASLPDFSDVYFTDKKESTVPHEIISSGNYDMIRDDSMTGSIYPMHLSDGTIVVVRNRKSYSERGEVALSEDNGKTWRTIESTKGRAERLALVDRDDNIYYCENMVGVFKLYAADNYETEKLVFDYANLEDPDGVTLDTNPADKTVITGAPQAAQTDDGYIYMSHYQLENCARLYGSDDGGETFKLIYKHPQAQHNHMISVNRNVTPNEVFVAFDWAAGKPVSLVSADHFKTYVEIDVPYRNSDFNMGYFGNRFSYFNNPEGGYALGGGESNILGGPTVYKTTDAQNPDAYYGVVETTQSIRSFTTPDNGKTILFGGMSGDACEVHMICASYDDGETWETIYAEEPDHSEHAGVGVGKHFSGLFTPKGSDEPQIIGGGDSRSYNLRMKFGEQYKYALCYVKLDIPANGKTIYLNVGGTEAEDGSYSVLGASKKADGTIASVKLAGLGTDNNAVLINALYDKDKKLIGTKAASISGDGNYNVDVDAEGAVSSKLLLLDSFTGMKPLKLYNNPLESIEKFSIYSNENMFAENLRLRLKLDEGAGSTVTDAVSKRTYDISGTDYIWTDDADIRYGALLPLKYRSNTSLKLNKTSYIDLGSVEGLDFSHDMTFAFWSNPETKRGYGTEWNVPGDEKQTHKQVLFKSDDLTIYQQKNYLYFRKADGTEQFVPLEWALSNTNYYNLYYVIYYAPKYNADGSVQSNARFEVYGNDEIGANQNKEVTIGLESCSLSNGKLYLGTPNPTETEYSMWFGLADVMIYDKALSVSERRAIYYGTGMTIATPERQ